MNNHLSPDQAANRHSVLIAGAIVGAALILSWGMPRSTPKYQLAASGDMIVRMNTESGTMLACTPQRCARVATPGHGEHFGPVTIERDAATPPALPKSEPQKNATAP